MIVFDNSSLHYSKNFIDVSMVQKFSALCTKGVSEGCTKGAQMKANYFGYYFNKKMINAISG